MRLLLVEDDHELAAALCEAFATHGYTVDHAFDGTEACEKAEENEYDLMVLDLNLPGIDGMDVLCEVRSQWERLPILVLTARADTEDRVKGLDLGADDYLAKPFELSELMARIRALLRRDMPSREPLLRLKDLTLDPAMSVLWQGSKRVNLTRKEFAIIEYLLRNPDRVVGHDELLDHIWGEKVDPDSNVVRVHINELRRKLGCHPRSPRYIETQIGHGYRITRELRSPIT